MQSPRPQIMQIMWEDCFQAPSLQEPFSTHPAAHACQVPQPQLCSSDATTLSVSGSVTVGSGRAVTRFDFIFPTPGSLGVLSHVYFSMALYEAFSTVLSF